MGNTQHSTTRSAHKSTKTSPKGIDSDKRRYLLHLGLTAPVVASIIYMIKNNPSKDIEQILHVIIKQAKDLQKWQDKHKIQTRTLKTTKEQVADREKQLADRKEEIKELQDREKQLEQAFEDGNQRYQKFLQEHANLKQERDELRARLTKIEEEDLHGEYCGYCGQQKIVAEDAANKEEE